MYLTLARARDDAAPLPRQRRLQPYAPPLYSGESSVWVNSDAL